MSSGRPDVSIVIPAYRAEPFIARAIRSVIDQPGVDPEIIVVVDGIFDRTAEIAAAFPPVRVLVNQTNQGAPAARNRGHSCAAAPYVMFLDADDYLQGALLKGLLDVLRLGNVDLAFGPAVSESSSSRLSLRGPTEATPASVICSWLRGHYVPPCAVVWRSEFLREIGGWCTALLRNQDGELVLRACLNSARIGLSDLGTGIYVQHDSPHRVSRRLTRESMLRELELADWLYLKLNESASLSPAVRDAFLDYIYAYMRMASATGYDGIGEAFQTLFIKAGGRGHRGSFLHRVGAQLLGLKRKEMLASRIR